MKSKNLSKILSFACLTPCVGLCTYSLVSCNKEQKVESISLEAKTTTLIAGDQVQINAKLLPFNVIKNDQVTWSCSKIDMNEPFLTQKGLFVVPEKTEILDLTKVTITATLISNPEIKNSIELTLNPKTVEGFKGFEDGKLTYAYKRKIDPSTGKYEARQVDLIRPDATHYPFRFKTAHPIDWFAGFMEQELSPIGARQFSFTPIFAEGVSEQNRNMMFTHTEEPIKGEMPLLSFLQYEEGLPTPYIPDASIGTPNGRVESITVKFAIDGGSSLELIIESYVYLAPSQDSSQAVVSYDKQPGDPHDIINHEQGNYETSIFCPADKSRHVYRESMSTIYIHKKYYEYLDLTLTPVLNPDNNLPQELLDMFNYKLDIQREVRPNDGFPYYRCYFYYTFDLDKMGDYNPAEEGYKDYTLLSLQAYDENFVKPVFELELKFNILWV